jgi:hypothetical protein
MSDAARLDLRCWLAAIVTATAASSESNIYLSRSVAVTG